ncbi:unnamed protein product [Rotaria socialis]|uniref:SGNH hydrolase-type esterase domain-containing protein n=1 Tax=Rotaria socialis TaxID=392032 RepID=A0A818Y0W2_9BILA|nr:unnamed protein product [Rotaria socialis]
MTLLNIVCSFLFTLIVTVTPQSRFPSTPVELRGLWCISEQNISQQTYTQQLGQAFFYNNETFTINFLIDIRFTWLNHFLAINDTDGKGNYQVFTDTTQGPPQFINVSSCFWRQLLPNGDLLWGRQSNGTCTPTFENETGPIATLYTRNNPNCQLFNDEGSFESLTDTAYESELLRFDQLLIKEKRKTVVFFGSSSFRLWPTLSKDFADVPIGVINRGFGGSSLKECWQQFKRIVLPLEPTALIVYAGENDVAANETASAVFSYFQQFIPTVRRFYPSLPIAYISIKPSPSRVGKLAIMNDTNNRIRDSIKNLINVDYIDVFSLMLTSDNKPRPELFGPDELHMNAEGYAIWTPLVKDFLKKKGIISNADRNQYSFILMTLIAFVCHFILFQ